MNESRVRLMLDMPLFGGMSPRALETLAAQGVRVEVPAGGVFFREGDAAQSMFVLEQGRASVHKTWRDRDIALRELRRGDCFGEMALIDCTPRSATVTAIEPCVALEIGTDVLLKLYETDLEQFAILQMNIAREISRRLRALEQRVFEQDAARPPM